MGTWIAIQTGWIVIAFIERNMIWVWIFFSQAFLDPQTIKPWNLLSTLSICFFVILITLIYVPLPLEALGLLRRLSGKESTFPCKGTQERWVWYLVWEDCLEEEMATHSSSLAWRILWTEEPGVLKIMGFQRVGHNWVTEHAHTHH